VSANLKWNIHSDLKWNTQMQIYPNRIRILNYNVLFCFKNNKRSATHNYSKVVRDRYMCADNKKVYMWDRYMYADRYICAYVFYPSTSTPLVKRTHKMMDKK